MSNDLSATTAPESLTALAWKANEKLANRPVAPGQRGWLIETAEKLGANPTHLSQSVEIFRAVACWPPILEQDMEQRAIAGFRKHVRLMPDPNDRVAVYKTVVRDPLSSPALRLAGVVGIVRDANELTNDALRMDAVMAASKVINTASEIGQALKAMRTQRQPGSRYTQANALKPQLS